MNNLIITSNGIKYFQWNGERRGQHKLKKSPGKVSIINRETGLEVFFAATTEEAEKFFIDETPIDMIWSRLREMCDIEDGVTLSDIYKLIETDDHFGFIVNTFYKNKYCPVIGDAVDEIIIKRRGVIDNGEYFLKTTILGDLSKNGKIICDKSFLVTNNGEEVYSGTMEWSLLEITDALFGQETPVVLLQKEGTIRPFFDCLMSPCYIGQNVTLGDIFKLVDSDEPTKLFLSMYSWCRDIDAFHKAAFTPSDTDKFFGNLSHVQIDSGIELYEDKNDKVINDSLDFHGFGPTSEDTLKYYVEAGKTPPENERYALGFSPMATLVDLPVKLGSCRLSVFGKNENGIEAKRTYTLLQILDAIYWEISFYGGPEEAAAMRNELAERVESIKSGEAKTIPFEDIIKELEENKEEE